MASALSVSRCVSLLFGHRLGLALVLALLSVLGAHSARPAPPPDRLRGTVVRVDGRELFIDIGAGAGLVAGDTLEVLRRIEIRHPVTNKMIVDQFSIGRVTVAEVGTILSIIKDFSGLEPRPQVGDMVMRAGSGPRTNEPPAVAPTPVSPSPTAPCPTPAMAPPRDAVAAVFDSTLGLRPEERIALWRAWLRDHPDAPRSIVLREELAMLERLVARQPVAPNPLSPQRPSLDVTPQRPRLGARVAFPERVTSGQPIEVFIAMMPSEDIKDTQLLIRRATDDGYTRIDFERDGDNGLRASLGDEWRTPGSLSMRVEAVRTSGEVETVSGAKDLKIDVVAPSGDHVDERGRSRASSRLDWMSFWLDHTRDQFWRFESDFQYSLRAGVLDSFRMGVGMFKGIGGPTDLLDALEFKGSERNINYGFAEIGLTPHELFGISARLLAGTYDAGDQREPLASIFGGSVEMRLGKLAGTRLYGGFQATEHIGNEFWLRVAIAELARIPMEASVVVTDLPVGADYGVSLGYGIGWQASDLFALMLRVGWNARTINHSGLTVGTGVVFTW